MKRKLLIFHPCLAPYRIDFFNKLSSSFITKVCFYTRKLDNQNLNQRFIDNRIIFSPDYFSKSIKIGKRFLYLGHLNRIISFSPDYVMVSEYGFGLWTVLFWKFVLNKKYKVITISDDSLQYAKNRRFLRKLSMILATKFLNGIILCNELAQNWYSQYNISSCFFPIIQDEKSFFSSKREIIKGAIHLLNEFNLNNKRVFLYVGRISPEKNIIYLIKSFIKHHNSNPKNVLFLVGGCVGQNINLLEQINKLIKDNFANSYIKLVGQKEDIELKSWFYLGQILILPSKNEAFGCVVNEALISGDYVMVSKYAGACCLVNQTNGTIIDIDKEYIDFDVVSRKVPPINNAIMKKKNLMPFSFEKRFYLLLEWINSL